MHQDSNFRWVKDVVIGVGIIAIAGLLAKYADIPTRVSVVETKINSVEKGISSMDNKLDILIMRQGKR